MSWPRRRSNSIPWCISFRLLLSLRTWRHHLFHALGMKPWRAFTFVWMNYHLNYVALLSRVPILFIFTAFQWEFCRYSEGFYFRFVALSRSTYKLCGKHMQTKKISHSCSHPCGCCELASGRIIRWGKKPWADTNIEVLLVISRYKESQDSAIVSGLLTDLRNCFCVLTMRAAWQRSVWGSLWNSKLILNQLEDPVEDTLLVSFYSVSTQVISQAMDWSDHHFGLSN